MAAREYVWLNKNNLDCVAYTPYICEIKLHGRHRLTVNVEEARGLIKGLKKFLENAEQND